MLRRLSPTERVWLTADALGAPFNLTLVVQGRGLERERVEEAVAQVAEANPSARGRPEGVLGWTRWVDSGQPPPVLERPLPVPGPVDERRLLGDGPGIELDLCDMGLAIRAHHAQMDGRGLWFFAEELFRALRGEELLGSEASHTDQDLAGEGDASAPIEDDLAATGEHNGETWPVWAQRRVEGRWSQLLGRLGVAVAEHVRSREPRGQVGLQVPVDLREGRRTLNNMTGLLRLEVPEKPTPELLSAQLRGRIERGEPQAWLRSARPVTWMPLWLMEMGGRSKAQEHIQRSRFGGSAVLSNLGRVDLRALDAPGFGCERCFWIPPCGPSTAAFVGLLGDDQGVEIVTVMPLGLGSDGRQDAFLDALVGALRQD